MFTGIIETTGTITHIETTGSNKTFFISSPISKEFSIDQSVSHNGVCLTVEEINNNTHRVTAIDETLKKTNLVQWSVGDEINLERCMLMNGRIDGHIVQGHVDCTATCIERKDLAGSWEYTFEIPEKFAHLIIEKGSISINGTSLTIFNVGIQQFNIAVIPYTFEHTNIKQVVEGSIVNIEFDMIGKYLERFRQMAS